MESGKWVGPAKSAAAGDVVQVNGDLVANPSLANQDPYDKGWFIILKPTNWDAVKPTLVPGGQVTAKYEAKMAADGGILLLHENCEGWGGLSGQNARRFIESVDHPNVRYLFDIGNTNIAFGLFEGATLACQFRCESARHAACV